jgi:hypothetical protein
MLRYAIRKLMSADLSILKPLEKLMAQLKIVIVQIWKRMSKMGTINPFALKRLVLNRNQRPENTIMGSNAKLVPTSRDESPPFLLNANVDTRSLAPNNINQLTTKETALSIGDRVVWLSGKISKKVRFV